MRIEFRFPSNWWFSSGGKVRYMGDDRDRPEFSFWRHITEFVMPNSFHSWMNPAKAADYRQLSGMLILFRKLKRVFILTNRAHRRARRMLSLPLESVAGIDRHLTLMPVPEGIMQRFHRRDLVDIVGR